MRTLFAKLLIWFLATILIMAIGFVLFENTDQDPGPGPQRRIAEFFLQEAGQIYRNEGSAGLRDYLQRIESTYGGKAFLVDASGRDLASGVDRAEFIRAAQEANLPWFSKDGASFNRIQERRRPLVLPADRERRPWWSFGLTTDLTLHNTGSSRESSHRSGYG